jgi:hypothetical protein
MIRQTLVCLVLAVALAAAAPASKKNKGSDKANQDDPTAKLVCCLDHPNKPLSPPAVANYDCSQLVPFGQDRCNKVYGGNTCQWATGKECITVQPPKECRRVSHYEVFGDQRIDVGRCTGPCKAQGSKCKVAETSREQLADGTVVEIVKSCECATCYANEARKAVEVPAGECEGRCERAPRPRTCRAGVEDNFSTANGPEPSNPSAALLSGILASCSAGVQPGFDTFADNRCFGHTFEECFERESPCPLRRAVIHICLEAAPVSLTWTDSLILAIGGSSVWGIGLPALNGGTWNIGEQLCVDLDLDNLPGGGASILALVDAANSIDVAVQDDTAVDFIDLSLEYENCLRCLPKEVTINTIYTANGVQNIRDVRDCDCTETSDCERLPLEQTYFPGTIFETTVDVGQCAGTCPPKTFCQPAERSRVQIKAPHGLETVAVTKSCRCQQLTLDPAVGDF